MRALKKRTFCKSIKSAFPYAIISNKELISARGFVVSLMQWDMNKRPSVQEIENHLFLKGFEISGVLNENMESVVKNPFLKGSINPETIYVSTRVQESITENHQKNGTFNCYNVVTNPFMD